jgi:hypothetical protein
LGIQWTKKAPIYLVQHHEHRYGNKESISSITFCPSNFPPRLSFALSIKATFGVRTSWPVLISFLVWWVLESVHQGKCRGILGICIQHWVTTKSNLMLNV